MAAAARFWKSPAYQCRDEGCDMSKISALHKAMAYTALFTLHLD